MRVDSLVANLESARAPVVDELRQLQLPLWTLIVVPAHPESVLALGHHAWLSPDDMRAAHEHTTLLMANAMHAFGALLRRRSRARLCVCSHSLAGCPTGNYATYTAYSSLNAYVDVLRSVHRPRLSPDRPDRSLACVAKSWPSSIRACT